MKNEYDLMDREVARMMKALQLIGYSKHTNKPRFGPKAQVARWGLGRDRLPKEERDAM